MTIISPFISTFSDIERLSTINGESIATISTRLQNKGYLRRGFDLQTCISRDWETLQHIGTTPAKLADLAENFLKKIGCPTVLHSLLIQHKGRDVQVTYYCVREDECDPIRSFENQKSEIKIPSTWKDRATIKYNQETITLSTGKIALIRELGFFGNTPKERVSPTTLYARLG